MLSMANMKGIHFFIYILIYKVKYIFSILIFPAKQKIYLRDFDAIYT